MGVRRVPSVDFCSSAGTLCSKRGGCVLPCRDPAQHIPIRLRHAVLQRLSGCANHSIQYSERRYVSDHICIQGIHSLAGISVVGMNFGILLCWVSISMITIPLFQWHVRRRQVREWEATIHAKETAHETDSQADTIQG